MFNEITIDSIDFSLVQPVEQPEIDHWQYFSHKVVQVFFPSRDCVHLTLKVHFVSGQLNLLDFDFFDVLSDRIELILKLLELLGFSWVVDKIQFRLEFSDLFEFFLHVFDSLFFGLYFSFVGLFDFFLVFGLALKLEIDLDCFVSFSVAV